MSGCVYGRGSANLPSYIRKVNQGTVRRNRVDESRRSQPKDGEKRKESVSGSRGYRCRRRDAEELVRQLEKGLEQNNNWKLLGAPIGECQRFQTVLYTHTKYILCNEISLLEKKLFNLSTSVYLCSFLLWFPTPHLFCQDFSRHISVS